MEEHELDRLADNWGGNAWRRQKGHIPLPVKKHMRAIAEAEHALIQSGHLHPSRAKFLAPHGVKDWDALHTHALASLPDERPALEQAHRDHQAVRSGSIREAIDQARQAARKG